MKEDRLALVRAVHSNDPDLVIHVLLDIRSRLTPGDFFALVDDGTSELAPAIRLLEVYAKESDRDLLRDLYYQDDRRLDSAMLELEEAWSQPDPEDRISHLKNAAKYFSEDKARHFEAKVCWSLSIVVAVCMLKQACLCTGDGRSTKVASSTAVTRIRD